MSPVAESIIAGASITIKLQMSHNIETVKPLAIPNFVELIFTIISITLKITFNCYAAIKIALFRQPPTVVSISLSAVNALI